MKIVPTSEIKFQIRHLKTEKGKLDFWSYEELSECDLNRASLDVLVLKLLSHRYPSHTVNFGTKKTLAKSRKMPLRDSTRRKSNENKENENTEPGDVERAMIFPNSDTNPAPYQFCESQDIFQACSLPFLSHLPDSRGFSSPTYSLKLQAKVKYFSQIISVCSVDHLEIFMTFIRNI
jgi:hypothetical protein